MDPLARALRFAWAVADAAADEAIPLPQGTALRTPSLPEAWSANALRLEGPHADLDLDDVDALSAAQVRTPYRHVLVEDEWTALRLLDAAVQAEGWSTERELVMALEDPPPAPRAAVRDGTLDEISELMSAWLSEEGQPPATVSQLVERTAREHAAGPERRLVADHDGRPAAMCTVRLGDGVAQLEDVFVRRDARGSGLGQAVTAAGAQVAADSGAGVVFIVADDRDWPKELYAKVGFAPLGRRGQLHRSAAGGGGD